MVIAGHLCGVGLPGEASGTRSATVFVEFRAGHWVGNAARCNLVPRTAPPGAQATNACRTSKKRASAQVTDGGVVAQGEETLRFTTTRHETVESPAVPEAYRLNLLATRPGKRCGALLEILTAYLRNFTYRE